MSTQQTTEEEDIYYDLDPLYPEYEELKPSCFDLIIDLEYRPQHQAREKIRCSRCFCRKSTAEFGMKKNGNLMKTCNRCRRMARLHKAMIKFEHSLMMKASI